MKSSKTPLLFVLSLFLATAAGCVSGGGQKSEGEQSKRLYWKVYPKSDNTFYILPRPELTTSLPSASAMNNLKPEQAEEMVRKLNSNLQFTVKVSDEAGTRMVRVAPEPLIEDIVEVCKGKNVHPFLQSRCSKELNWAAKGIRPDIYLQLDDCQAVVLANALNRLYGAPAGKNDRCPELDQVEK
ncbi:MAG: hypothetical protein RLZZ488_416 [Pseudomonadota bacterium]